MRGLDEAVRSAEAALFSRYRLSATDSVRALPTSGEELRVWRWGSGEPVVFLHAAGLPATSWLPLAAELSGVQVHLVELPGHGLAGPSRIEPRPARRHGHLLVSELLDELSLSSAHLVGNSLGGTLGLWFAAACPERVRSFTAMGVPAPALPGVAVPPLLSLLMARGIGPLVQRVPAPVRLFRVLISQILGRADAANAPRELVEVARLSSRRPGNVRTLTTWLRELDGLRKPRPGSVLSSADVESVRAPCLFLWGEDDPVMRLDRARSALERFPSAVVQEVRGGHAPWLTSPGRCAELLTQHLRNTGTAH
ncbi:alpha/beta hydrolase [Saccharopolyspora rhizosphaerae]|uniref:Alpha/beta hydrolase n=1 Tax=Saccharopolyspora rhizosphaerae TaxID=2492662 RepID=A0A3R8NXH1_9PSEU|nr:alpha/beta hydrolase [Saccharopolyspora rhizosphaerae]RRO15083.1 alpha/beta hydrolase [Saccharopolyspora rhizosphaerae]